jgi:hypothetical protein
MVFFLVKFHLNPWVVVVMGVSGSTLGKYIFSLYVPKIADQLIKRRKREELEFMGKKLNQKLWQSWLFVFIYTLTPLSTTVLFTAAAIAKVKAGRTVPPFFFGKFVSDAVLIFTGRYAVLNLTEIVHGAFSAKRNFNHRCRPRGHGRISVCGLACIPGKKAVQIQFQNLEMKWTFTFPRRVRGSMAPSPFPSGSSR